MGSRKIFIIVVAFGLLVFFVLAVGSDASGAAAGIGLAAFCGLLNWLKTNK